MIYFLNELEILTTDLNQNIGDQASVILNYYSTETNSTIKAQMNAV